MKKSEAFVIVDPKIYLMDRSSKSHIAHRMKRSRY